MSTFTLMRGLRANVLLRTSRTLKHPSSVLSEYHRGKSTLFGFGFGIKQFSRQAASTAQGRAVKTRSSQAAASTEGGSMADRKLRYIDIGANLLDSMYQGEYHGTKYHEPDLDAVLSRAWQAGVEKIIITAGTLEESRRALELAKTDERLFCTVGVHPTRCGEFEACPEGPEAYLAQLAAVLQEGLEAKKVVAVGECGLDYDREQFCDRDTQKRFFAAQFELVKESGLPMFLHMRAACEDFIAVLGKHLPVFKGGVVHSFTGSIEDIEELIPLHPKLAIGINGCSLKTHDNLDAMSVVPLDRLMLETDAPWCGCRPTHASAEHVSEESKNRWKTVDKKKHSADCLVKGRCEPCNIDQVLDVVAGHRGLNNKFAVAETIFRMTEKMFFSADSAAA